LPGAAAFDLRLTVELGFDGEPRGLRVAAGSGNKVGAETFLVVEQDFEQMFRRQALMAAAQRQILGRLNKSFRVPWAISLNRLL